MFKPSLKFEGPNLLREGLAAPMHREALMQQQPGENSSNFQLSQVKLSSTNMPPPSNGGSFWTAACTR